MYDSYDRTIWTMRFRGYSDEALRKLIDEHGDDDHGLCAQEVLIERRADSERPAP